MEGARSILLSITGGTDLSLWEVNEAAKAVSDAAHPDANIIFGAMVDETLEDQVWVTVVATRTASRRVARSGASRSPRASRASSAASARGARAQHGADRHGRQRARRARVPPARLSPTAREHGAAAYASPR